MTSFSDNLTEYIIASVRALAVEVNDQRLAETPFTNGVLSPAGGGTGVANSNSNTLTLSSAGTLDLGGATLSLPVSIANGGTAATSASAARSSLGTNDAANITTGTLAAARLGASPTASKILFGDNTWDVLVAGDLPSHTHAAADITSGTLATARLGSGSATATTLLHGDSSWAAVSLTADVSGILPAANGGTGINNSTRTLTISTNAGTLAFSASGKTLTIPDTGTAVLGTGANTQVGFWTGTNTLSSDSGLTYNSGTNALTAGSMVASSGGFSSTTGYTYGSATWTLGTFTAGGDTTSNGYVSVVVNGTTRKLMCTA